MGKPFGIELNNLVNEKWGEEFLKFLCFCTESLTEVDIEAGLDHDLISNAACSFFGISSDDCSVVISSTGCNFVCFL